MFITGVNNNRKTYIWILMLFCQVSYVFVVLIYDTEHSKLSATEKLGFWNKIEALYLRSFQFRDRASIYSSLFWRVFANLLEAAYLEGIPSLISCTRHFLICTYNLFSKIPPSLLSFFFLPNFVQNSVTALRLLCVFLFVVVFFNFLFYPFSWAYLCGFWS